MATIAAPAKSLTSPTDEPFVTLVENQFAAAAVERLIERGENTEAETVEFNLVYLHGPAGVGKSHLSGQLVWNGLQRSDAPNILHVTAAELIARVDEAQATARLSELRKSFLQLDMFVCEDLAAIERRSETQRLIIAAIDETLARGGRVLITGSKSPGELERVTPRLISRLHGGVCAAIGMPEATSRRQLLLHFARLRHVSLPADTALYLAESLPVSPRELRAAVARLDALSGQAGAAIITRTIAETYLEQSVSPPTPGMPEITKAVAKQFGVSVAALRTGGRTAATALPRQVAMSLSRELTGHPLGRIAGFFGRQNHGTVIHARKKLASRLEDDPALRGHLLQIRRRLGVEAR